MTTQALQKFFRPGQFLFREGEPSNCIFLIKKGTVSIRKMKGPAFVEIARIYSNEVLGELSFFDRLPRSAAAIALTEVETLVISFDSLDKVYAGVPDYMKTIIASVADRLRKANDTIRRLQKNVITEQGVEEQLTHNPDAEAPDAASAVASAIDLGLAGITGDEKAHDPKPEAEKTAEAKPAGSGENADPAAKQK
jgi:CRP-like cAMP-binding protein